MEYMYVRIFNIFKFCDSIYGINSKKKVINFCLCKSNQQRIMIGFSYNVFKYNVLTFSTKKLKLALNNK